MVKLLPALALIVASLFPFHSNGQILISLLFGDKLNSDGIEFGLDGGLALTNIAGAEESDMRTTLNLGMYFDIRLRNQWYLHTGFIVKSPGGIKNFDPYPINNPTIAPYIDEASSVRKLSYTHIPAFIRYKYYKNAFVELGPQFGFLRKARDEFSAEINGQDDLTYTRNIRDEYSTWDAGLTLGLGTKIFSENGITLGVRYYYGLTDITTSTTTNQYNRNLYIYTSIPIGADSKKKEE